MRTKIFGTPMNADAPPIAADEWRVMRAKISGTPIIADAPPIAADNSDCGCRMEAWPLARRRWYSQRSIPDSSAAIGGASAIIGVQKTFASVSHQ